MQKTIDYIQNQKDAFLDELKVFLSFPSVSTDPMYKKDVDSCASYVKNHLEKIGMHKTTLYKTSGHPIIYSEHISDPKKPTVLFYGHYDVQPADPLDLWISEPFKPTIRDGQIYARGVSDDKGQVFCHLQAIEALIKTTGTLPINFKCLIEGEEEIGSQSLFAFVEQNKDLLKADAAIISDTPMYSHTQPSICFSLRGLLYTELVIQGPNRDLHSGQLGGIIQNPIQAMAVVLSKLKDEDQIIQIPEFYNDVTVLPESLRKKTASLERDDEGLRKNLDASEFVGEEGFDTNERRWFRPTLDCNGIIGGFTGDGAKTVIPSTARAKISMRLVANQNPDHIFAQLETYLKTIMPKGVSYKLSKHSGAKPAMVNPDTPAMASALQALKEVHGVEPVLQGEGGTIPIVNVFKETLGLDTILMGFNLPHDNIHSPNEKFSLENYYKGIESAARFYIGCQAQIPAILKS